ncbi:putative amine oxidase [copper-containing] [Mya arenaria]|uniref:putative amine oxidase [copper-containing] n=1 Tax=Mya arenaria TaxID=6604 RepID=UPI0022E432EF|nr:putative amine oxidase [copper-containing] [Mya arenaria]
MENGSGASVGKPKEEPVVTYRRTIGLFRIVVCVLAVLVVALSIAFAVVVTQLKAEISALPGDCPDTANIDLNPPKVLPPFHDLTQEEISQVKEYLYDQTDLGLVRPKNISTSLSYIFLIDLHVPNKDQVIGYLDHGQAQPVREARVTLFMGDRPEPFIQEYTVGPLPNPYYKKDQTTFPFRNRPTTAPELKAAEEMITAHVNNLVPHILEESYDGKLGDCGKKCLAFKMISTLSTATSSDPRTRKLWFGLNPVIEFESLHSLDFAVLIDVTSSNIEDYKIDKIYYAGDKFNSLEDLKNSYEYGSVLKTRIPYPEDSRVLYSTAHRRGPRFPEQPQLPPRAYEPDGKRYSIQGRHLGYMGWQFDLRMSSAFGPQLFDIRYQGDRIVYELSLQDIAVFYSANNPTIRFADYVDSVSMIGSSVRPLIADTDCPIHSTFIGMDYFSESTDDPVHVDRAFCVFEHNTGMPLRRHLTSSGKNKFYEGMMDIVLTVRTITTITNYDYIFDFIFHQNGALEVKAVSTGYILTSFRFPMEDEYGFRLKNHLTGNIHHHMFHYKVDMDINGRENRFETIEIVPREVDNSQWSTKPDARYAQTRMMRRQRKTEVEATVDYDFSAPKYLTFYNDKHKTETGLPRAYRILVDGMSKQMLTVGRGQEASIPWARHQLAVTKYHETERRSSSIFANFDGENPTVNFQAYIDNDEVLTDQDQVAWVTMGVHHIPHTEDLPVTSTVGLDLRFLLLPNNYFQEDPAMGSGDAVRIEPNNQNHVSQGLHIQTYGKSENSRCFPRKSNFYSIIQERPGSVFTRT